jgi:2-polyprenyl-3-methyl-5-hydroxy-6-metoxy-1,4-benzoquinol methylase
MTAAACADARPDYDLGYDMEAVRGPLAAGFARQILATCEPFLSRPTAELRVLDVGCGYGHTARELARQCGHVTGIEPHRPMFEAAERIGHASGLPNLEFRHLGIYDLPAGETYDLIVLDNVFEHLPDQPRALEIISRCLSPGGVAFLLTPNRLWPIEVHYGLPFLSYLPLVWANRYLRLTGRGTDYTDASYARTYWGLNRLLRQRAELTFRYVLPADLSLATCGRAWHYRLGVAALRRCPWLWAISKALLVVLQKKPA